MPDVFVSPKTESPVKKSEENTYGKFSSFYLYPENIDFETREEGEEIILMLRKHIVTNAGWAAGAILLLFVPTVFSFFGVFGILPGGYGFVATMGWYLVIFAYVFEKFLTWYFNVYFVTNLRIIEVSFNNLINKQVSAAIVEKVQDVTYTTTGIFRTVFDFGNVFIQTAAEVEEFDFFAVPHPERVAKVIDDLKTKGKENGGP